MVAIGLVAHHPRPNGRDRPREVIVNYAYMLLQRGRLWTYITLDSAILLPFARNMMDEHNFESFR
jgi:hypothetical protein